MMNPFSKLNLFARIFAVLVMTLVVSNTALAESFQIESAVMDSSTGKNLGVSREAGGMADFFKAQKRMTYGILQSSGIDVATLPPDVRTRLEKFQTVNLEAFKAFSQGLDLADDGKFAQAQVFFEKAEALDPNFKLAQEMKVSMPNVNLPNLLVMHTVIRDNAKTAVESGKKRVELDLAQATAAMVSGQTVLIGSRERSLDATKQSDSATDSYTSNAPGSGGAYLPRKVVGIVFDYQTASTINSPATTVAIATTNEWTSEQYRTNSTNNALESVGIVVPPSDFAAQRGGAGHTAVGSHVLSDGSSVYWGTWLSTTAASASVTVSGKSLSAPILGANTSYMMGDATKVMPTSGNVTFTPAGGFLGNVTGSMAVNFVTRQVDLLNLGFTINNLSFSQLNGNTTYSAAIGSGFFKGNYTSGVCTGCNGFTPGGSTFSGNFVGTDAKGAILSNIMQNGTGTVAGVHLFAR